MLSRYLNQMAQLSRAVRDGRGDLMTDERGRVQYSPPVSVRCRAESRTRELMTAQEQVVRVQRIYYMLDSVLVGDMIDDRRVEDVIPMVNLGGAITGYKAVT